MKIGLKGLTTSQITYASWAILWESKLQKFISLSTTESEYVALSQYLRDTIPAAPGAQEPRVPLSKCDTCSIS